MSQQVGLDLDESSQLDRGAIRGDELIDDHQSGGIGEGRIPARSELDAGLGHTVRLLLSVY